MRTLLACTLLVAACSNNSGSASDGGTGDDMAAGGGAMSTVSFAYHPSWSGVVAVSVIGGFGMASDWTQPLVTLTADGNGGFAGSAMLPAGQYLYLFKVVGDAAAAMPASFSRYAVDPSQPAFSACPMASPSYSKIDANPCSQLTVPQASPSPTYAVQGGVTFDGNAAPGWLAVVERDEPMSHHYFVDRADSASDGSFSFTLAPGHYRVQILNPTYLSKTDLDRSKSLTPDSRRVLSSAFSLAAPVTLNSAEVAYHDYDKFAPSDADGGVALPTTFDFTVVQGAVKARLAVYGGQTPNIGDPWFASPYATATSVTFNGTFNTMQAGMPSAVPGDRYFWGTWQVNSVPDAGVQWTRESQVVPIQFR